MTYINPKLVRLLENAEPFDDWPQAFDTCRERNRPLTAKVTDERGTEVCKIFPSGHGQTLIDMRAPA